MHHFIYATKDTWISSGSNHTTGETEADQNFGQDQILEIKKNFWDKDFDYQTRALVQFDLTDLSSSLVNGDILDSTAANSPRSASYYLRLYEAEGNQELSTEYTLAALPISESWDEGTGKFGANPKITNGVSWNNRNYFTGNSAVTWSQAGNMGKSEQGVTVFTSSLGGDASQSFSYQSPDIEMDVTDIVKNWLLTGSNSNNGFLIRFSGSQETDSKTFGQLKFFSSKTHTIYPPKLEARWDDHAVITGSATGSLTALTMSGAEDNYLYMKRFREKYRESEKVKFRIGARKRYIQKTFSTSVQTITGSYIPENSGSYSIVDVATGESIIPFSDYTKLSCDSTSNYFIQWLNGFAPDRVYKILLKLNGDDGQEQIFDEGFEFIVTR